MMDPEKRAALEAAGFRFGDAADFLGLNDEERRIVEMRVRLARTIREQRARQGVTQTQLAKAMRSSQARVAKVEAGVGVTLDLMVRALFALGAAVEITIDATEGPKNQTAGATSKVKTTTKAEAVAKAREMPKGTKRRKSDTPPRTRKAGSKRKAAAG